MSNYTKIIENIWLGNVYAATDINFLKNYNIRSIINVTKMHTNMFNLDYMQIPITDNNSDIQNNNMYNYFERVCNFIKLRVDNNINILIHCEFGASRSATILLAYLMKYHNIHFMDGIKIIRDKRNVCFPKNKIKFKKALSRYTFYIKK